MSTENFRHLRKTTTLKRLRELQQQSALLVHAGNEKNRHARQSVLAQQEQRYAGICSAAPLMAENYNPELALVRLTGIEEVRQNFLLANLAYQSAVEESRLTRQVLMRSQIEQKVADQALEAAKIAVSTDRQSVDYSEISDAQTAREQARYEQH